ncbi:MAG TPA: ABC transporter permease subunit, partial [Spirochaetes bacterium]|nr:ABC transporter permease subunit [Spirochaetota bacterium]
AIVFGLFGLGFFIQFIGKGIDGFFFNNELVFGQPAIVWAALTLALLTMPVVIVATEEALRNIPNEIREASYALGATKFQTIVRLVLPNAFSGILTGAILAVSRGAGEVAPILFTGAAYFLPNLPGKLSDQFMELGYHIFVLSTQSPNVDETKPILYSTVLVLLVLTFLLNFAAIIVRYQLRKKFQKYN